MHGIRRGGPNAGGIAHASPICAISRRQGDDTDVQCEIRGAHWLHRCEIFEDFTGDTTIPESLTVYDLSGAGSPTAAKRADIADGIFEITLASTNEDEFVSLNWGDQRVIPGNRRPLFQTVLAVPVLPSTNERMVWGLASDLNITLDSVAQHAWFRLEASGALLAEADNATTDVDDQSTGVTLTAGTYYLFSIDHRVNGDLVFRVADKNGKNDRVVKTITTVQLTSTTLQPFFTVQKATGTGVPSMYIDAFFASWDRAA